MAKHALGKPNKGRRRPKRSMQPNERVHDEATPRKDPPEKRPFMDWDEKPSVPNTEKIQQYISNVSGEMPEQNEHRPMDKPRRQDKNLWAQMDEPRSAEPRAREAAVEQPRRPKPRVREAVAEQPHRQELRTREPVVDEPRKPEPRMRTPQYGTDLWQSPKQKERKRYEAEQRAPQYTREPKEPQAPAWEEQEIHREPERQTTRNRTSREPNVTRDYDEPRVRPTRPRDAMSQSMKGAVILLSVLVLITIAALIAWDQFMVKDVVIYGLKTYNYAEVVKLTGIGSNQNIFLTDLDEVEQNIERNPNIDVVDVKMILPSKIEITVSERLPTAVMQVLGQYLLLDESAIVLGVGGAPTEDYVSVSGMQVTSFELGKIITSDEVEKLNSLQAILTAISKRNCLHLIDSIDITDENNVVLMAGEKILIKIGSANEIENKCVWIHDMVPTLVNQKAEGILHITDKNTAHFVPGSVDIGNNTSEE